MNDPHVPHTHKQHAEEDHCGCWIGEGDKVECRFCGALYLVDTAPHKCLDCNSYISVPRWYPKANKSYTK